MNNWNTKKSLWNKKHFEREAFALSRHSTKHTALALLVDWGCIFLSIAAAERAHSFPITLCALLIIASRQHALLVLMHEGAHGFLARTRWINDGISDFFTAWPFGASTAAYRTHHWLHHRYTNSDGDPDWIRKKGKKWTFPKSRKEFGKLFWPYLAGFGLLEMIFIARLLRGHNGKAKITYYICIVGLTFYSASWSLVFFYWVLPATTLLPAFMKLRSIVEHLALPRSNDLDMARNILSSPIESFFLGPHNNSLHLVHHLFPQVPWWNIKKMQTLLMKDPHYSQHAYQNASYFFPSESRAYDDLVNSKMEQKNARTAA